MSPSFGFKFSYGLNGLGALLLVTFCLLIQSIMTRAGAATEAAAGERQLLVQDSCVQQLLYQGARRQRVQEQFLQEQRLRSQSSAGASSQSLRGSAFGIKFSLVPNGWALS